MMHSFDVNIATEYGLNAAIILNRLEIWIEQSRANRTNAYDGKYWCCNSCKALSELFPYMSEYQIRSALKKLEDAGIIIAGHWSENVLDRTFWYTFSDDGEKLLHHVWQKDVSEPDAETKRIMDTAVDPQWIKVVREYEANIGMMPTGRACEMLMSYVADLTGDVVCMAIRVTSEAQPSNKWTYLRKILNSWAETKVDTVEKAQREIDTRKQKKQGGTEPPAIIGKFY